MMRVQSINPVTEQVNKEFETFTKEQCMEICSSVKDAFDGWRMLQLNERIDYIKRLAVVLRSKKEEYAKLITLEMGRPITNSPNEIEKCAFTCDVYAQNAQSWLKDEPAQTESKKSFVAFEPIGTVLEIMPWNFPFWQVLRCAIPALTLGNVCVLRHSNSVPMCALAIEEAFKSAGFPQNVFRTVISDHQVASSLIKSRFIDAVSLTGSTEAGKEVAKVASKNMKKFVLELGGSDPFIVLDDADMDLTCKKAVEARNQSSGQSCIAAKRFIVMKKVANEFTEKYVALTKNIIVGDPMDPSTQIGPLANEQQLNKLDGQIKDAVSKGAKVECGGSRLNRKGYFYAPTVITGIKRSMRVTKEEVFGPVSPIIIAKKENDAIKIANSTSYGLGASVWTRDLERGERLARGLEVGVVGVNEIEKSDPRLPFGGIKQSGIGRELSRYGLLEFANIKSIKIS